jgi:ERCC4-type nuclease
LGFKSLKRHNLTDNMKKKKKKKKKKNNNNYNKKKNNNKVKSKPLELFELTGKILFTNYLKKLNFFNDLQTASGGRESLLNWLTG